MRQRVVLHLSPHFCPHIATGLAAIVTNQTAQNRSKKYSSPDEWCRGLKETSLLNPQHQVELWSQLKLLYPCPKLYPIENPNLHCNTP